MPSKKTKGGKSSTFRGQIFVVCIAFSVIFNIYQYYRATDCTCPEIVMASHDLGQFKQPLINTPPPPFKTQTFLPPQPIQPSPVTTAPGVSTAPVVTDAPSVTPVTPPPPPPAVQEHTGAYTNTLRGTDSMKIRDSNGCLSQDLPPKLQEWVELQNRVLSGGEGDLIYNEGMPWAKLGIGNRLNGVISALLIGILTHKAVVINTWQYPTKWCHINGLTVGEAGEIGNRAKRVNPGPPVFDQCFHPDHAYAKKWRDGQNFNMYKGSGDKWYDSNCPSWKWIAQNPDLIPQFKEYGLADPDKEHPIFFQIYHRVSSIFMGLKEGVWNNIKNIITSGPHPNLVSVQIRMGVWMNGKPRPQDDYLEHRHIPLYFDCVDEMGKKFYGDAYTVFVSSDTASVMDTAKNRYGDRMIRTGGDPKHTSEVRSGDAFTKIITDNFLLSLSDVLLVTPGSTYSAAAAMIGRTVPYYIEWNNDKCVLTDLNNPPYRHGRNSPEFSTF